MDQHIVDVEEGSMSAKTVAGLRALADLLEANPDLYHPFTDDGRREFLIPVSHRDDPKADLREWSKASAHLRPVKRHDDAWAALIIDFGGGVRVQVYADREKVCKRVVVGTREVTSTVPDPEALAAVPQVEVTETVEDVEWICLPFLAAEQVPA